MDRERIARGLLSEVALGSYFLHSSRQPPHLLGFVSQRSCREATAFANTGMTAVVVATKPMSSSQSACLVQLRLTAIVLRTTPRWGSELLRPFRH